jgi:hemolysin III
VNFAGAALSWPCAALLLYVTWKSDIRLLQQLCFSAQGIGLVAMLNLSALYHHKSWDWKNAQRVYSSLDQVGINAMIMGCYAPLMVASGSLKVLGFVWVLGCLGISLQACKLLQVNIEPLGTKAGVRWTALDWLNVLHYLLMGWAIAPILPVMIKQLPYQISLGIIAGGLLYTLGVPFLIAERIEFHQACWHGMVLMASTCFYVVTLKQAAAMHGSFELFF